MIKGLEKIKDLSWEQVFDIWRKNEASSPKWIAHYQSRGFSSWEDWRKEYATPLRCSEREWSLYRIIEPLKTIPAFHGGPFRSWIDRYYGGKSKPTFAQIAQRQDIQQRDVMLSFLNNFPKETTITGFFQNDGITIIEGMHRCVAIALAAQQEKKIDMTVYIALADASSEELTIVGQAEKKDTHPDR